MQLIVLPAICQLVVEAGRAVDVRCPATKGHASLNGPFITSISTNKVTLSMSISKNYARTRRDIPDYVTIVVSFKTRTP